MAGLIPNEREVGITAAARAREWAGSTDPALVAEFLTGGITKADVQRDVGLVRGVRRLTSMPLPPLPNCLFQRDPSCWLYDGVTIDPMTKPARKPETMIMEAIHRFHPMFTAEQVPHLARLRIPQVVYGARTWAIRPGDAPGELVTKEQAGTLPEIMAAALGVGTMRVIKTGGDTFEAEREQWDDGNNVVALGPRRGDRVSADYRHEHRAAQGRHRGDHHCRVRARPRAGRLALHVLPAATRPSLLTPAP